MLPSFKMYFSETVGTFALVFMGTGAAVVNETMGGILGVVGVGLVFGLIVMAMIYSVGNVSGAHFNPAVTVSFWVAGRLPLAQVFPYVVAQVAGAMLASVALWYLFPKSEYLGATLPQGTHMQSFVMEFILTFILMFVILNVSTGAKEKGMMAGVAIGSTVALEAIMGGPVSGASMNPARSLSPALMSGHWEGLWIYLSAPFLGAMLASPVCALGQEDKCC